MKKKIIEENKILKNEINIEKKQICTYNFLLRINDRKMERIKIINIIFRKFA
jgi:hypothetical protein